VKSGRVGAEVHAGRSKETSEERQRERRREGERESEREGERPKRNALVYLKLAECRVYRV